MTAPDDPDQQLPEWLTTGLAAQVIGVGRRTVARWIDDGILDGRRADGGHRQAQREAVLAHRDARQARQGRRRPRSEHSQ